MGVDYGKPKGEMTSKQHSYVESLKSAAKQRLAAGQGPKKKLRNRSMPKKMPARQGFDAGNYKYPR